MELYADVSVSRCLGPGECLHSFIHIRISNSSAGLACQPPTADTRPTDWQSRRAYVPSSTPLRVEQPPALGTAAGVFYLSVIVWGLGFYSLRAKSIVHLDWRETRTSTYPRAGGPAYGSQAPGDPAHDLRGPSPRPVFGPINWLPDRVQIQIQIQI